jgi:hypothetical protein
MGTLRELAEAVAEEKLAWDRARIELERARSQYEFAERRLVLAKERFYLELRAHPEPQSEGLLPRDLDEVISSVQYMGDSIKSACKWVLGAWMAASSEEIADRLEEGGFQFKSDVPVREVHAALMKQPWAKKNQATGMWEYQDVLRLYRPDDPDLPSLLENGGEHAP